MFDKIKKLFTGDEEDIEVMGNAQEQNQTHLEPLKDELEEQGLVNLKDSQSGVKDFFQEKVVEKTVTPVATQKPVEETKKVTEKKNTYRITEVISPIRGRKDGSVDIEVSVSPVPSKQKTSLVSELIRPISHKVVEPQPEKEVEPVQPVEPVVEAKPGVQSISSSSVVLSTMIEGQEDRIVDQEQVNHFSVFTDDELASIKTESLQEIEENYDLFGHVVDIDKEMLDDTK